MKKTKAKKIVKPKVATTKKKQKIEKGVKAKTPKKEEYPAWTMPEHLSLSDHDDLKKIFLLHNTGEFKQALDYANGCDTIIREAIPPEIWKEIGGEVVPKKEEMPIKKENKKEQPATPVKTQNAKFHYILKQDILAPLPEGYLNEEKEIIEAKFNKKSDLEEFIIKNSKTFFGENIVFIDNTANTNEFFPNLFLFDFKEEGKPRMYVIEINISDDSLGLLYARITHFIASLKRENYMNDFLAELGRIIDADNQKKEELLKKVKEGQDIPVLLSEMLNNRPAILLVRDEENVVLNLMQAVYVDTWGRMVRQILIQKYYCNDDKMISVKPDFRDIWKDTKGKKPEIVKNTEDDHLLATTEIIRGIYNEIKNALLKTDGTLEFNPKKHYISIRKNKNLAFLHLRKKSMDIVVMNPEEDTRKQIKYHRIKTLPESVQKFWNGACCTVVVENKENLDEVIGVMKKIVKNA